MNNLRPSSGTIRKVRALSIILGFLYCGGLVWYLDIFLSRPLPGIMLLGSTGVALIITPLLSDTVLRIDYIRVLSMLLLLSGLGGSLYSIVELIGSAGYWWDKLYILVEHVVIIFVLVVLGIRIKQIGESSK